MSQSGLTKIIALSIEENPRAARILYMAVGIFLVISNLEFEIMR